LGLRRGACATVEAEKTAAGCARRSLDDTPEDAGSIPATSTDSAIAVGVKAQVSGPAVDLRFRVSRSKPKSSKIIW
jgi:hypothetical protein